MTKGCICLVTLVPLLALPTVPANADCKVVGYANGEPQCMTTSDGPGQPYTDARTPAMKQAMHERTQNMLRMQAHRRINHQGWRW